MCLFKELHRKEPLLVLKLKRYNEADWRSFETTLPQGAVKQQTQQAGASGMALKYGQAEESLGMRY